MFNTKDDVERQELEGIKVVREIEISVSRLGEGEAE